MIAEMSARGGGHIMSYERKSDKDIYALPELGSEAFGYCKDAPTEEEFAVTMGRRYERMLAGQETEHDLIEA